jgi:oligopeptide transport system substrate-binding protein
MVKALINNRRGDASMSSWIKRTALAAVASIALMGAASAEVVYNRANSGEPETLDTHKTSTVQESHILRDMLEGLVAYDAKGEVIPGQATKWEISDDGKTYRFTLRDGIKWSNGDPVKASDFVFSYRRIMNPETGASRRSTTRPSRSSSSSRPLISWSSSRTRPACRCTPARWRNSARTSSSRATW